MAYHVFAAGEYDPESPLVTQFFSDMIGNFTGLANGDTGHPQIINPAIVDPSAGVAYNNRRYGRDVGGNVWHKAVGWKIPRTGTYRCLMSLRKSVAGADNTSGEWYIDDVATGTVNVGSTTSFVEYTDDIALVKGEILSLYTICITLGPWQSSIGVTTNDIIDRMEFEDGFVAGDVVIL